MKVQKVKINSAGARALLKSSKVQKFLADEAGKIADAAGPGMDSSSEVGPNRARAEVFTRTSAARRAEARDRSLTQAATSRKRR